MVNAEKVQGAVTFGIRPDGYWDQTSDLGLPASGVGDRWFASVVSLHTDLDCERLRSDV